ncbi:MAG: ABC transporter ATP-binding protein [Bacillota bacterium]
MKLILDGLSKEFRAKSHNRVVLDDVGFDIRSGEFVCLIGPSGCGKTTLLNIIAGFEKPDRGQVLLDGKEITGVATEISVIFQDYALFPWLNVLENVEYGMKMSGISRAARREKALKYLKMVHLTKHQNAYVHELSGGMKQRVAIARSLASDASVLLMDEPFAALDYQTRRILQAELQNIWQKTGKTMLLVTHNVEEAVLLADRVFVMSVNPGRIKKEYRIDIPGNRHFGNPLFAEMVEKILDELMVEVEKAAKEEYDSDWHLEKNGIRHFAAADLGIAVPDKR